MIERSDIENLANLSRIKLTEAETISFQKEIESILGYVAEIQKISSDAKTGSKGDQHAVRSENVFREDVVTTTGGAYTEALLDAAPAREGGYLKVKNIF